MILQTKSKDNKAVYELTVDLVEDAYRKRSLKIGISTNQGTNIGMYICEASAGNGALNELQNQSSA